jgi:hypothetical protein
VDKGVLLNSGQQLEIVDVGGADHREVSEIEGAYMRDLQTLREGNNG